MGSGSRDRGGRATCAVILLAALALSLLPASTAAAARSEFYGIVHEVSVYDGQDSQGVAAAGVHTDRFWIHWGAVERSNDSFDWSRIDRLVGGLASKGIRPVPFVYGSPPWIAAHINTPPVYSGAQWQAWGDFLKAAVARYGPGGTYWANRYHQQYGASATPWPVQSWQIWNEPNLGKFWYGGPKPQDYGTLLHLSYVAIKSVDPSAQVVLAGMPGYPSSGIDAWTFLNRLYNESPNVKDYFDVAAVHPYASNQDKVRNTIVRFRNAMKSHGDGATPLWITEFAWGSGSPDRFGINQGLNGQAQHLTQSYNMFLANRNAWNLQRVFWFFWRDPKAGSSAAKLCSFCGSAGLLRYNRTAKPALTAFKKFTADKTRPKATITSGPAQGSTTQDTTPTFMFKSSDPGSTFACRFDAKPFAKCSSPFTPQTPLASGPHAFYLKAIDPAGNESPIVSRSFKVG